MKKFSSNEVGGGPVFQPCTHSLYLVYLSTSCSQQTIYESYTPPIGEMDEISEKKFVELLRITDQTN